MSLNEDHGLTPEEEAALNFKEDENVDASQQQTEQTDPDAAPAEAGGADPAAADAAAGADDAKPAAAADADPAPAAAPAAEAAAAPEPQAAAAPAPILIAQAPEDAAAQLAKIETDKEAILDQYEAGEITDREKEKLLDALNDQKFEIKQAVREAELAQKLHAQQVNNQWTAEVNSFLKEHTEYADPASERHKLLDETIKSFVHMPSMHGVPHREALETAHRMVQVRLGETPTAAPAPTKTTQPKVPTPAAPPNIGSLPAAAMNDTTGGEFAKLDALQKSGDIDAYENAVGALSEAQRARYFKS